MAGECEQTLACYMNYMTSASFSPDGKKVENFERLRKTSDTRNSTSVVRT